MVECTQGDDMRSELLDQFGGMERPPGKMLSLSVGVTLIFGRFLTFYALKFAQLKDMLKKSLIYIDMNLVFVDNNM